MLILSILSICCIYLRHGCLVLIINIITIRYNIQPLIFLLSIIQKCKDGQRNRLNKKDNYWFFFGFNMYNKIHYSTPKKLDYRSRKETGRISGPYQGTNPSERKSFKFTLQCSISSFRLIWLFRAAKNI